MQSKKILKAWDKMLESSPFGLIGEKTIADWCIWPFVRQYRLINTKDFDNDQELLNINKWLKSYLNHHSYETLMKKFLDWTPSESKTIFP